MLILQIAIIAITAFMALECFALLLVILLAADRQ